MKSKDIRLELGLDGTAKDGYNRNTASALKRLIQKKYDSIALLLISKGGLKDGVLRWKKEKNFLDSKSKKKTPLASQVLLRQASLFQSFLTNHLHQEKVYFSHRSS